MERKHTPGPWTLAMHSEGDETLDVIVDGSECFEHGITRAIWIAQCDAACLAGEPGMNEANAWLIAAAPDLLAACEAVLAVMTGPEYGGAPGTIEAARLARAAIAKATAGGGP